MRDCSDLNNPMASIDAVRPAATSNRFGRLSGRAVFAECLRVLFRRLRCDVGLVLVTCALLALVGGVAVDAAGLPAGAETSGLDPGPPISDFGGGSFFSQELGTLLRLRYNTESYGQQESGNLDIGTMQVVNFDDAVAFFDGQVTLNDDNGTGFNLGVGFRWLDFVPFLSEPERITGVSVWADGTHTEGGNFFPQVGVTYESLGDMWDFRVNGYIPVGQRTQVGKFVSTGEIGFVGNSIAELTQAPVDTSFDVAELEVARRLGAERDAWAFAGGYALNSGSEDAAGYRVGLRGYAYPDLMLQIAVSDDEVFSTNAAFTIIWFVGRTRTDFQPTCGLPDRFREPVSRNDYVALSREFVGGGIALTDPAGEELRVVHVDSDAEPGGDGTFEHPLSDLDDILGNSQEGDIVYIYSESQFSGESVVLQDDQQLFGEGDGMTFSIATATEGTIDLPESSPGAQDGDKPIILNALGNAVTLADSNEVANLLIDGGTRGVSAGTDGAGDPNLHDLMIQNTTAEGIYLTPYERVDTEDADNDGNTTESVVAFNVTIDNVMFDNIGTDDISIDANTTADIDSASVTLQEVISISDIMSTNNGSRSLRVQNTHSTGTTSVSGYDYDGGAGASGAMSFQNFDATFSILTSSFTGGTLAGVSIGNDTGGTFTFDSGVTFEDIGATVFDIDGLSGAIVTVNSSFTNDTGYAVSIANAGKDTDDVSSQVLFMGDITNTDQGIRVIDSEEAFVQFAGDVTLTTGANDAVTLMNNTEDTDINFNGELAITATSGRGFFADNGGTLTAANNNNTVQTSTGTTVEITDSAISTLGVSFGEVNRTSGAATQAILLRDNTDGPIVLGTVGDDAGDSGTLQGGAADVVVIQNSDNATISGLVINNAAAVSGVRVNKSTTGTQTVNLNDLEINGGNMGVEVVGNSTGTLNMTASDTDINTPTATGISFDDIDAGTIQVNNVTVDGNSTTATAGVIIANSDASFTFDADTVIQEVNGTAFEVDGGSGTVSMSGDITNTSGDSIHVHDIEGGTVTMLGDVTDTGTGITIDSNTDGDVNLLGDYTLTTTTSDAVSIFGNASNVDISLTNLDITTTSGKGFTATGGGDLTVSGGDNTITTTTGTGLEMNGMNVVGQVSFESVSVTGASTGISLTDVTGGQVAVGETNGADGSGGTLDTTGNAIVLTNVTNVALRDIDIVDGGGNNTDGVAITNSNSTAMSVTMDNVDVTSSSSDAVNVTATGSGTFNLTMTDSDFSNITNEAFEMDASNSANDVNVTIDAMTAEDDVVVTTANTAAVDLRIQNSSVEANTSVTVNSSGNFDMLVENSEFDASSGGGVAFTLTFNSNAEDADVIIQDNDGFTADDANAFLMTATGTNVDIDFSLDNNVFANDSNSSQTVDIEVDGGATLDATVVNNNSTNSGTADEFYMLSDGSNTRINLDLNNNGPAAAIYQLDTQNNGGGFNFGVVDRDNADANNPGSVMFNPLITDFEDIDSVQTPVLP